MFRLNEWAFFTFLRTWMLYYESGRLFGKVSGVECFGADFFFGNPKSKMESNSYPIGLKTPTEYGNNLTEANNNCQMILTTWGEFGFELWGLCFHILLSKMYLYWRRINSQPEPGIFCKAKFFSTNLFRFWSLGYPEVRGSGWWGHTWLSTFPELVWRSVQNLVEIGWPV